MGCLYMAENLVNGKRYRAAQETVERARASGRWMESAAVQIKIIELNQELAEKQVLNEKKLLPGLQSGTWDGPFVIIPADQYPELVTG